MHKEEIIADPGALNFPWLTFRLGKGHYAISSRLVSGILNMPDGIVSIPDSSEHLRGLFSLRGSVIPLADLRTIMHMGTIQQEYEDFREMLEARKQDHLRWVVELERCVEAHEVFKLATDPHKCAFGKWYDKFETDKSTVSHHLQKIEEPHARLHNAALELASCTHACETCAKGRRCVDIMAEVRNRDLPIISRLLDEAKDIFRGDFHEMVIALEQGTNQVGIAVDEVLAVEQLEQVCGQEGIEQFGDLSFIIGVAKSETIEKNVIMIDDQKLIDSLLINAQE